MVALRAVAPVVVPVSAVARGRRSRAAHRACLTARLRPDRPAPPLPSSASIAPPFVFLSSGAQLLYAPRRCPWLPPWEQTHGGPFVWIIASAHPSLRSAEPPVGAAATINQPALSEGQLRAASRQSAPAGCLLHRCLPLRLPRRWGLDLLVRCCEAVGCSNRDLTAGPDAEPPPFF